MSAPPAALAAPVAVLVVTHDDAHDLPACLAAVAALAPAASELVIVDCASADDSVAVARRHWPAGLAGEVLPLAENRGFAGGMNVALAKSHAPWVLTLNADARPAADYLARLLAAAEAPSQLGERKPPGTGEAHVAAEDQRPGEASTTGIAPAPHQRPSTSSRHLSVGAVTGRLVRPPDADGTRRLDACGMRLTPAWRHHDRGSGAPDHGQLAQPQRVFGGTGAATLWRREALLDVAVDGEVFDERFHSFREDAELCFRLRERRWEVLYEPAALCEHRRANLPSRRGAMPAAVNFHSLKNRYLLRLYHQTFGNLLWTLPFALFRDLQALAWVLLAERTSLPAYRWLWAHRRELLARRRAIRSRRTAGWWEVERWFLRHAIDLDPSSEGRAGAPSAPGGAGGRGDRGETEPKGGGRKGGGSGLRPRGGKVALIGSRGIPARYGGYETLCDELAGRLTARGFAVTVYCRSHYTRRGLASHRGARLVVLPTLPTKHLDTPVHTFLACLHAAGEGYDAALVVNSANALFVPLLGLAGTPTALHVDGIERRRSKWGPFGRAVYALSERLAGMVADVVISDAEVIRDHYLERYGLPTELLTYGVEAVPPVGRDTLERLGLVERGYALYVSRFEPENNPHRVVEAYRAVGGDMPLVMVGDAPYASAFIASFRDGAEARVRFPGAVYGEGYRELLAHAWVYVHATEVGGTHPALVEAMGYGNCVVVNDTPENREVAGEAGVFFRAAHPASLADALERLRRDPAEVSRRRGLAASRAAERYDWERVADGYAALLRRMVGR